MGDSNLPGSELLKSLLEPLLDDFHFWFTRSRDFLETRQLSFMSEQEQDDLLYRVKQAQEELRTARMLFNATDGQVGLDMSTLNPWHDVVTECWNAVMRFHQEKGEKETEE
ncbi:hypothetical protein NIES22_39520 [Calothrix brevissima NIES-22]|nr:hypothetical protein NIES22_39520 [Calothrix brevissima NIES-22]